MALYVVFVAAVMGFVIAAWIVEGRNGKQVGIERLAVRAEKRSVKMREFRYFLGVAILAVISLEVFAVYLAHHR